MLVVRWDIGCNGLWVRWGCGSRLGEIEEKEEGEEKREKGGVGGDEARCTTPESCSLAVWAEGRVNGKFSTTCIRRCEELRLSGQSKDFVISTSSYL